MKSSTRKLTIEVWPYCRHKNTNVTAMIRCRQHPSVIIGFIEVLDRGFRLLPDRHDTKAGKHFTTMGSMQQHCATELRSMISSLA